MAKQVFVRSCCEEMREITRLRLRSFMNEGRAEGVEMYIEDRKGVPGYIDQDYTTCPLERMEELMDEFEKEANKIVTHYWHICETDLKLRNKVKNQILKVIPSTHIHVKAKNINGFNVLFANTNLNDFEPEDNSWMDNFSFPSPGKTEEEDIYDLTEFYKELEKVDENAPFLDDEVVL